MSIGKNDECPLILMWAITGAPSRDFLYERMKNFSARGITQLMIYARSGLAVEYMSEAWLDICEWICEDGTELGFTSIWLYDERNWPSGTCNGEVLRKDPNHAIQALCVSEVAPGEYDFGIRRGTQMIDLFNPDAVDSFIELTHGRYEKRLGKYFGTLIKGFFSDETQIARFADLASEGYAKILPWYDGLEADYHQLTGGHLKADIERGLRTGCDLWQSPCNQLYVKKFRETFFGRISRWCEQRNMLQTGHLMGEHDAGFALKSNGHLLELLSSFSLVGIDDTYAMLDNDQAEYLTYSSGMYAIEKRGNNGGIIELFAVKACDTTLEEMCSRFYFCAAFGLDRYMLAISQIDVRGNVEKNIFFSQFAETQPWFDACRELGECAGQAARWAAKERICEVAVRYPYEPQPLAELLRNLADTQFNWKLVMPGEETDAPVVLSCVDGRILEERSGTPFFHFGMLYQYILREKVRQAAVYETDGELAHGVFVRAFKDRSVLVINLSGKNRELVLKTDGRTIPFSLSRKGFFTWEPAVLPEKTAEPVFDLPQNNWEITLDSPNSMRVEFEDGVCEFTVQDPLADLKLVVRDCGTPVELLLDGQTVDAVNPCGSLVQGFRELYRETAPFALAPGKHVLSLAQATDDYAFLPVALLMGHFAGSPDRILSGYRNDGAGLYGYVGRIILKQKLVIPAGTGSIQAETLGLVADLAVDGIGLGRCIRSPFVWKNPGKSGLVEVELTLYTSCARLFGEKAFHKQIFQTGWVKTAWPHNLKPLLFYTK